MRPRVRYPPCCALPPVDSAASPRVFDAFDARASGTSLFNRLSLDAMQRPGEVVLNVSAAAQRLWTSMQKLEDVPPQHYVELCSMINRVLRDDERPLGRATMSGTAAAIASACMSGATS